VPALRVEAPAIGAAILAGMGTRILASVHDGVAHRVEAAPAFNPDPVPRQLYRTLPPVGTITCEWCPTKPAVSSAVCFAHRWHRNGPHEPISRPALPGSSISVSKQKRGISMRLHRHIGWHR
jgi:hypothetical protein